MSSASLSCLHTKVSLQLHADMVSPQFQWNMREPFVIAGKTNAYIVPFGIIILKAEELGHVSQCSDAL